MYISLNTLKELYTATRFTGRDWLKMSTLGYVVMSTIALFAPLLTNLIFKDASIFTQTGTWVVSILGGTCLAREYFLVSCNIDGEEKRKTIRITLAMLNHMYEWQGKCRITMFIACKSHGKKLQLVPYERTGGGAPPGVAGSTITFNKNEGVPGKAWGLAWNGNNVNQMTDCFVFGDVPSDLLGDREQLREYYKKEFDLDSATFDKLSDEKLQIASYMSIGILNHDMSLAAVLVIDSDEPNKFYDFKRMENVSKPFMLDKSNISLSITQINTNGNNPEHPELTMPLEIPLEGFFKEILNPASKDALKLPQGKSDQLPSQIKKINRLRAVHQTSELSPANIQSALLPLEWTLKTLREMKVS